MSNFHLILAVFEYVVLLFSLSLHEAAHAWMASRLGDPTARMLGRITMNPAKHIDLFGTIILPAIMLLVNPNFLFGWAKPTPVTQSNFRNLTRDDILTTIAGPCSNILAALAATAVLLIFSLTSARAAAMVHFVAASGDLSILMASSSPLIPLVALLYLVIFLNLILAVFNLIPVPPLDGSHVFRHLLPYRLLRAYDSIGIVGLFILFIWGGPLIGFLINPALTFIRGGLLAF